MRGGSIITGWRNVSNLPDIFDEFGFPSIQDTEQAAIQVLRELRVVGKKKSYTECLQPSIHVSERPVSFSVILFNI